PRRGGARGFGRPGWAPGPLPRSPGGVGALVPPGPQAVRDRRDPGPAARDGEDAHLLRVAGTQARPGGARSACVTTPPLTPTSPATRLGSSNQARPRHSRHTLTTAKPAEPR